MKKGLLILSLSLLASASAYAGSDGITGVLAGKHRSAEATARDVYRHPAATLGFFGLTPEMKVLEIWPGDKGWYTEILAPYLAKKGQLTVTLFGKNNHEYASFFAKANVDFKAKFMSGNATYGDIKAVDMWAPTALSLGDANSFDRVFTFRNLHNWVNFGQTKAVLAEFYRVLKPGGILGVTDHRADAAKAVDPKASNGYVKESEAIRLIQAAGFVLIGSSGVNNNPKDTKDYKAGVWSLPPTYAMKDVDKEKLSAIGESDRFTLKFVKR